eukprot:g65428.t1
MEKGPYTPESSQTLRDAFLAGLKRAEESVMAILRQCVFQVNVLLELIVAYMDSPPDRRGVYILSMMPDLLESYRNRRYISPPSDSDDDGSTYERNMVLGLVSVPYVLVSPEDRVCEFCMVSESKSVGQVWYQRVWEHVRFAVEGHRNIALEFREQFRLFKCHKAVHYANNLHQRCAVLLRDRVVEDETLPIGSDGQPRTADQVRDQDRVEGDCKCMSDDDLLPKSMFKSPGRQQAARKYIVALLPNGMLDVCFPNVVFGIIADIPIHDLYDFEFRTSVAEFYQDRRRRARHSLHSVLVGEGRLVCDQVKIRDQRAASGAEQKYSTSSSSSSSSSSASSSSSSSSSSASSSSSSSSSSASSSSSSSSSSASSSSSSSSSSASSSSSSSSSSATSSSSSSSSSASSSSSSSSASSSSSFSSSASFSALRADGEAAPAATEDESPSLTSIRESVEGDMMEFCKAFGIPWASVRTPRAKHKRR